MFLTLSLPFLYGQLFCRELIGYIPKGTFDLSVLVSKESEIQACLLIVLCQVSIHLGVICFKVLKKEKNNFMKIKESRDEIKALKEVGIFLLIISIIPAMYCLIRTYSLAGEYGYEGISMARNTGVQGIFVKIVPFFQIALLILMVAYKNNNKLSKCILFFSIFYYGIQIFFGERGKPLIGMITTIWLYNAYIKKIDKKIIIIALICIIPASAVLNVIRQTRDNYGVKELSKNINKMIIENIVDDSPVFDVIYEMGTAIYPIAYTIQKIPDIVDYKYGESYLFSLVSVFSINISRDKPNEIAYKINIAKQMTEMSGSSFGGSYIQEAYANFGWYCCIFMYLIGLAFGKIEDTINNCRNLIDLVLLTYLFNPILWAIRNVFVTIPREIFWYVIPVYVIYKIFVKEEKNEK